MTPKRSCAILTALLLVSGANCPAVSAYLDGYPPFQKGEFPQAGTPITSVAEGGKPEKIQVGSISVVHQTRANDKITTQIFDGSKKLFDSGVDHEDEWVGMGSRVYVHDLTGDGKPEILVYTYLGGVGLASGNEMADLFISQKDGGFKRVRFLSFYAGPEDFVDTDRDGRYEMIWLTLCYSSGHSYWVYRAFAITEDGLVPDDKSIPGLPRVIWYTEKPNDKPTSKLRPAERAEVLADSLEQWRADYRVIE